LNDISDENNKLNDIIITIDHIYKIPSNFKEKHIENTNYSRDLINKNNYSINNKLDHWLKWKDCLCCIQSLSNLWFFTWCSVDSNVRIMYHKEFPVLSSLFLLLMNNKKTIDDLEDNIHAYFYFDEKTSSNCKNNLKYGGFSGVSSFIDDLCEFSSCKAIFQYEINTKINTLTMKSHRTINFDNNGNSFSLYLEEMYTNCVMRMAGNMKNEVKNIKMSFAPHILVLLSDEINRNGREILQDFEIFGNKYVLCGGIYNDIKKSHFFTITPEYIYDGQKSNGIYQKAPHNKRFDLHSNIRNEFYIIMAIYRLITTNLNNIISNTNSNIDTTIENLKFVEPPPRSDIRIDFMKAGNEGKYEEVLQFQSGQRNDATILFGIELMYSIKVERIQNRNDAIKFKYLKQINPKSNKLLFEIIIKHELDSRWQIEIDRKIPQNNLDFELKMLTKENHINNILSEFFKEIKLCLIQLRLYGPKHSIYKDKKDIAYQVSDKNNYDYKFEEIMKLNKDIGFTLVGKERKRNRLYILIF